MRTTRSYGTQCEEHPQMKFGGPKSYSSMAEFEREEIRPGQKIGWSLDDLYAEATFNPGEDDSLYDDAKSELNFDWS